MARSEDSPLECGYIGERKYLEVDFLFSNKKRKIIKKQIVCISQTRTEIELLFRLIILYLFYLGPFFITFGEHGLLLRVTVHFSGETLPDTRHQIREDYGASKDTNGAQPMRTGKGVLEVDNGENQRSELSQCNYQGHCERFALGGQHIDP